MNEKALYPKTPEESYSEEEVIEALTEKIEKKLIEKMELYHIYDKELKELFAKYSGEYNKRNPSAPIEYKMNLWERRGDNALVTQAGLRVECKYQGLWEVVINATTSFKTTREYNFKTIWKTGLYKEVMYQMISSGLTLNLMLRENRK